MTDTETPEAATIQGVPTPNPQPEVVIDDGLTEAERRLHQRAQEASKEQKTWRFRSAVYKLRPVMPATVLAAVGDVMATKNVGRIIDAIVDLFTAQDAPKVREALLDTSVEYPVDIDFLQDTFTELMQLVTGRGLES